MMRPAMLSVLLAAALAPCMPVPALAQVSMGRLFATPQERATMDANRGASATLAPNSQGQQPAPGTPGGPAAADAQPSGPGIHSDANAIGAAPSMPIQNAPMPAPGAPDQAAGATPVGGAPGQVGGGMPAGDVPGQAAGAMPADGLPGQPAAGAAAAAAAPPALTMSGILRRGDRHTTVWLNNQPLSGVQGVAQKRGASTPNVTVTLPSGRKVILKAGQRYDLTEGRIKDIDEP